MTNDEKQILREMTAEPASNDILSYVEDMVPGAALTDENKDALRTKAEYWFMAGINKGYIIATDQIAEMAEKTLEAAGG